MYTYLRKGQGILSRRHSLQTSTGAHSVPTGGSVDCDTAAGNRHYPLNTAVPRLKMREATFALPHLTMTRGKVKFTLEQATKAQRGSRSIAVLFL